MEILIEKTSQKIRIRFEGTAKKLLSKFKINPETALVVKNGVLVGEEDILKDKDRIRILSVISGG